MDANGVNEQLKKLAFKTPRKYVGKDPTGNDYVTARYVMNVLDSAVGPANWSDTYRVVALIERPDGTARMSVECSLTVLGVTKVDVGYGEILLSNSNKPYGQFEKEAYSIAFKRAAVKFGIARDLYKDGMPTYEREAEAPAEELDEAQPEPDPKPAPPKPTQPAASEPPPWTEDKPHWIDKPKARAAFWAYTKNELGLTPIEVHEALGVESVKDYTGTMEQAKERLDVYADEKSGQEQEPLFPPAA